MAPFIFVMSKYHRRQDYVKRLTLWGAFVCLRIAPSSKICVLWSESVKSKQRSASRGENMQNTHANLSLCSNKPRFCLLHRILFLRQQIKELEKLKNQNSFMVWELLVESWSVLGEERGEPFAHSWKQFSSSGAQCHTHTHGSCSLAGFGSLGSENREGNNEELLKCEEEEERLAHFTRIVFVKCHNGENL